MRIGVSLEIVVRLFLSLFADLSFPILYGKIKYSNDFINVGGKYGR